MQTETRAGRIRWTTVREIVVTLAIVAASAALVWDVVRRPGPVDTGRTAAAPKPPIPAEPLSLEGAAVRGNPAARVALVEYGEFQCPACREFATASVPGLLRDYVDTGRVRFAFRHLPLVTKHPLAVNAGIAAECAARRDLFWPMYEALFAASPRLEVPELIRIAGDVGLEGDDFSACLEDPMMAAKVFRDADEARRLRLNGVPTVIVGTVQPDGRIKVVDAVYGVGPADELYQILDRLLAGESAVQSPQ